MSFPAPHDPFPHAHFPSLLIPSRRYSMVIASQQISLPFSLTFSLSLSPSAFRCLSPSSLFLSLAVRVITYNIWVDSMSTLHGDGREGTGSRIFTSRRNGRVKLTRHAINLVRTDAGASPRKALRGGISKSILKGPCQFLSINAHKMAPRTGRWLQERGRDTPT